ncbi:MAG: Serine/threonine-protein phosphatase [candidate division TM6 bacterium GW2011_GWE2_41_16]|nr:MAG: Serine/threonine-protein phosphatase [candidate division TM6 bacterium GW2011_GWE2_41_16]
MQRLRVCVVFNVWCVMSVFLCGAMEQSLQPEHNIPLGAVQTISSVPPMVLPQHAEKRTSSLPVDTRVLIDPAVAYRYIMDMAHYAHTHVIPYEQFSLILDTMMAMSLNVLTQRERWLDSPTVLQKKEFDQGKLVYLRRKIVEPYDLGREHFVGLGDVHGEIHGFAGFLDALNQNKPGEPRVLDGLHIINPHDTIVLLGDYIDRGKYSAEVVTAVSLLWIHNPGQVFVIRGNHEFCGSCLSFMHKEAFAHACFGSHSEEAFVKLAQWFSLLPVALLVVFPSEKMFSKKTAQKTLFHFNQSEKILFCHGGPAEEYKNYVRFETCPNRAVTHDWCFCPKGYCNFCFSDFNPYLYAQNISENGWQCGCCDSDTDDLLDMPGMFHSGVQVYDELKTRRFCQKNNITMILRGHQHDFEIQGPMYWAMFTIGAREGHKGLAKSWAHYQAPTMPVLAETATTTFTNQHENLAPSGVRLRGNVTAPIDAWQPKGFTKNPCERMWDGLVVTHNRLPRVVRGQEDPFDLVYSRFTLDASVERSALKTCTVTCAEIRKALGLE